MARYGQTFKDNAVARLLPPQSCPVEALSARIGIGAGTLEQWRAEALARAADNKGSVPSRWTASARLDAVIATAAMDEATRAGWCRAQGIFLADLEAWKQDAIAGLGELKEVETEATKQDRRRIKELERDLARKDKALAETGRLACAEKNSRRSSTKARTHDPPGRSPDPGSRYRADSGRWRPAGSSLRAGGD